MAGVEFVRDAQGAPFTYDVNTNTNYNGAAEAKAGRYGMKELARFLGGELEAQRSHRDRACDAELILA